MRIDLPYTTPPLTLNGRHHWRAKAAATAMMRRDTCVLVRAANIPPMRRVRIELHYVPRDKRRRDPINLAPVVKACEDGVVDAGVIPDDTPEFSAPTPAVIDAPDRNARTRLYLLIEEDAA